VFAVFILGQMFVARFVQYEPLHDVDQIYRGAISLAETGRLYEGADGYYARFAHQWGTCVFMSYIFKLANFITASHTNYFLTYAGMLIAIVNLGAFALFDSVKRISGEKAAVVTLLVLALYAPFYIFPDLIYTDSLSMAAPIIALNIWLRMDQPDIGRKRKIMLAVLLGVVVGLGALFKVTVLIVFIAIVLTAWIAPNKPFRLNMPKYGYLGISILFTALILIAPMRSYRKSISDDLIERWKTPKPLFWVAAGLQSTAGLHRTVWHGSTDVEYYYDIIAEIPTLAEREEYLKKELVNNIRKIKITGIPRFIASKMAVLYGRVDYAPGATIPFDAADTDVMVFLDNARWSTFYLVWNGIIFYGIVFLAFISIIFYKRSYIAYLAAIGVHLFFIFWEATPKYLQNYFFVMLYLAALTASSLVPMVGKRFAQIKTRDKRHG
jgi:hypothetical protein